MIRSGLFVALASLCACATAERPREEATAAASSGARQRLDATIRFLADEQLEGRGTPSRGLDIAALYLAAELRAAGWQPGQDGSYLQTYETLGYSPAEAKTRVLLNGHELKPTEFVFQNRGIDPATTPRRYDLMFGGHAIVWPERGVDQLGGADLRGKAVIALKGGPWPFETNALPLLPDHFIGKGVQAMVRNAAASIYVTDEFGRLDRPGEMRTLQMRSKFQVSMLAAGAGRATPPWAPIVAISPEVFDRELAEVAGGTYDQWQERLTKSDSHPRTIDAGVEIQIDVPTSRASASNVVATLPGSDLNDEWVVLMAHYDHLGTRDAKPGEDRVYHGADDNASGSAAVLEVARRLASGGKPRRSVLCLLTSGEERYLLGSAWYTLHPIAPIEKIAAYINVDMVGRSAGDVSAIAALSPEMAAAMTEAGAGRGIRVGPDPKPEVRSIYLTDSYSFARLDVPGVHLFTDFHADYHQVTDTADKIRLDELVRISQVIEEVASRFAHGAKKVAVKRPAWFLTPD